MPLAAAFIVATAHAGTTRLDGWPLSAAGTDATLPDAAMDAVARLLAVVPWPLRHGAIALACTALAMACLASTLRCRGVPSLAALLVTLVAACAPVAWTHAVAPSGSTLVLLASAAVAMASCRAGVRTSPLTTAAVATAAVSVLAVAAGLGVTSPWRSFRIVAGELGGPGLVLLALGLTARSARRPVTALAVAGALTVWLGPDAQTAAMLPWAWILAAGGVGVLRDWRVSETARAASTRTAAWLVVGLAAWLAVGIASRDWRLRADVAAVQHTWARAAGAAAGNAAVVAGGRSPAALRVGAWQRHHAGGDAAQADEPAGALVLPDAVDARWSGHALASRPAALATVAAVLTDLPPGVIVAVAVAGEAVAALDAADWQALGRIGARPVAGPHPRVVVGVSGGRLLGQEQAGGDHAAMALLSGDLIAPTAMPSPIELHIQAGAYDVTLRERGRVRAAGEGLLLAAYRRDGRLLAAWTGAGGRWLGSGLPGEAGPPVTRLEGTLPCRDVEADRLTMVGDLAGGGSLGVLAAPGTRISLESFWEPSTPGALPRIIAGEAHVASAAGTQVQLVAAATAPLGIDLRGGPDGVAMRASSPVRVCAAAAPDGLPTIVAGRSITLDPADDAAFARGWHASEPLGGGRAFRWMDGTRGVLLVNAAVPVPDVGLTLSLDAMSAGEPATRDTVRLTVNGQPAGTLPLRPGHVTYSWDIPAALLRPGLNELEIETTLAVRPSDVAPGADGRLLGLAVFEGRIAVGG